MACRGGFLRTWDERGTDATAEIREAAAELFPIPRDLASQGSGTVQLGTNQILRELDPAALNTVLGLCKSKSLFIFHYRICFAEQKSPSDPLLASSRGSRYWGAGEPGKRIQQGLSPSPLRRSLLSAPADAQRPQQPPSPSASELRPSSPALRDSSCEHCGSSPCKTPYRGQEGLR